MGALIPVPKYIPKEKQTNIDPNISRKLAFIIIDSQNFNKYSEIRSKDCKFLEKKFLSPDEYI